MRPNHFSTVAVLALLAGGCANMPSVGPNYHAPATKAPAHWAEPLAGGETNAAAAVAAWWEDFHDAELNSLVQRAVCSNLDLRIAQSRVREARAQYSGTFADQWPTVNGGSSFNRWRESEHQPVLGRGEQPEVQHQGVFLASDGAAAITGQVIYVDCGYQIMGM